MILALEGDADEAFLRRREEQRANRAIDRAIGDVEHAVTIGGCFEKAVETIEDICVGCRIGEQQRDIAIVNRVRHAFVPFAAPA